LGLVYQSHLTELTSSNDHLFENHWCEWNSSALEELVLELDPVQTQSVKRTLEQVHAHQHTEGCAHEYEESEVENDYVATLEAWHETVIEEHLGQLRMGKTKGPKSQITGSVRDCSKNELDGLDQLMNHIFAETMSCV
jgi:hypothetical protein